MTELKLVSGILLCIFTFIIAAEVNLPFTDIVFLAMFLGGILLIASVNRGIE